MSNFTLIENYIYFYHIDKFLIIPTYPESVQDSLTSTFGQTNPLARSAPIMSYSHSGPRTVQISLKLHRDMMTQVNISASNFNRQEIELGDDYVDVLLKQLQAMALPRYQANAKMVNPPILALRLGNEIYVKGVVNGGINVTYSGPILNSNKYAIADVTFTVTEIDPYDADTVQIAGSFRGLNKTLERRLFK